MDVEERLAVSDLVERLNAVVEDGRGAVDAVARARMRAAVLVGTGPPLRVGRYVVLERVGAGGMGVVYAAYDPDLDRRVALKVLHGSARERASESRARLLHEAQALAKLTHPNVVTVHDVGTWEPQAESSAVFIAMEYVDGPTLSGWLAERKRTAAEVVATMIQAGRGLAAAHATGIVHRDFKAENVMLGRDGRVRVMDFGLAAAMDGHAVVTTVGTPAYMAPEQLRGEDVTPATDQFGFCVTLWEALYGQRPFAGDTLDELRVAILEGRVTPPPPETKVPGWLRRALDRGLSVDHARRWPSMDALCDGLTHGAGRRRRRVKGAMASFAVLAGVGTWIAIDIDAQRRRAECDAQADAIALLWNDDAKTRLHGALLNTGVTYAQSAFEHATPFLDEYATDWRRQYSSLCVATEVEHARAPELWTASRQCMRDRHDELASVLWVLSGAPDSAAVQEAVTMAAGLDGLELCADDAWVARQFARVGVGTDAAREKLWKASALISAGSYGTALELAEEVVEEAPETSPGLRARALKVAGDAAARRAEYERAVRLLGDALELALREADDLVAFEAANRLVHVVGHQLARYEEGASWGRVARGLLGRIGGEHGLPAARLSSTLGVLYETQERYEEAEREHGRALTIWQDTLGVEHPYVAGAHNNLGILYEVQGRYEEAEHEHMRALAIWQAALGADHPDVAGSHNNLGVVYRGQGRYAEAEREHLRALAIDEKAVGPDHPNVAVARHHLGVLFHAQARYLEAEREHGRALVVFENVLGPDHPHVALSLTRRADARVALGRATEAVRDAERAVDVFTRLQSGALELADPQLVLARALWAANVDRRRARGLAREARATYAAAGPAHRVALAAADRWLEAHATDR